MKIAITGASGFVASHLLEKYDDAIIISRNDSSEEIIEKLKDVDVVFNLAGAPIIKRWTAEYKELLLSSRVDTTKTLVEAINQSNVKHFISTSAVGAYPDNMACDESFKGYGDDFLAGVCKTWEEEAMGCNKPTAILRFGVILGKNQGALAQMLPPFKLGIGGVIGDGKMMMSWIDIDDLIGIYTYIIDNKLTGIYNAVAPKPITNYTFTKTLGQVLHRPTIFPLPVFVLELLYGEGATVLTGSKEIYPKAIQDAGYTFLYPTIESSLQHLLK
ncbi:MAG: TIGR01777 family oxidoreductase [Sulfurimonadaceae bacterium]|nr:TIGR01777 family oxidoreductase [Sulfurimonadaceae bacterium]